jgi:flagellar biosynthetic protein FlhB
VAEESDLEKTEQPSPRRLEQAREEGQVPQSRELSTFLVTITGVAMLWLLGGWFAERMFMLTRRGFIFEREAAFDHTLLIDRLQDVLGGALVTLLPLFFALMIAAVAAPIMLGGMVFAPKALGFKFDRMNPIKGFGRMFSVHGLMEMVKAILKALLVGGIGALVLWSTRDHIFDLMTEPLEIGMPDFADTVIFTTLLISLSLGLLALMDVPFQLWQYQKKLRMTKEEVKRENKEQEGDPQVKGRIRAAQREMARRRMMAAVPEADVVVTNPTHFSVALKYDSAKMGAPIVVAKGRGDVALKIREIAKEHDVPMLEAPPLARALYAHCELEQAIPGALYTAVAEVMAYIYQLNHWMENGGLPPEAPAELPVPEGMDPGAPD